MSDEKEPSLQDQLKIAALIDANRRIAKQAASKQAAMEEHGLVESGKGGKRENSAKDAKINQLESTVVELQADLHKAAEDRAEFELSANSLVEQLRARIMELETAPPELAVPPIPPAPPAIPPNVVNPFANA